MKLVEFTKDFATKKKGDKMKIDGMIAADLLRQKVAKVIQEKEVTNKKKQKEDEKDSDSN